MSVQNERGLELALAKMSVAEMSSAVRNSFSRAWRQVASGDAGLMPEEAIASPSHVPALADVAVRHASPTLLDKLCVIKLNGGLGTGMGLEKAKSLITVKDNLTFLDFIARQILHQRKSHGIHGPRFLLMNSFSTSADTLAYLTRYPELSSDGRLDFLQSKVPKLSAETLEPVEWSADPELEWCPPGHGDIYPSLQDSGWADRLAEEGVEFLFISNSDNLGATADLEVLGYFAESGLSFLMEVAERTASDRKGGHLAQRVSDGRLVLREVAQCPEDAIEAFQDISRHRYFNTNNLWIRLQDLREALAKHGGSLPLPLIKNAKTVDPRDASSPKVLQLEGAMGAAISCFAQAGALLVPRTRFAPVKSTGDLLALRSDAYGVTLDQRLELLPERRGIPPEVVLDGAHYKRLSDLEAAFENGAPSLRHCSSLRVEGPWYFEPNVICEGSVTFSNPSIHLAPAAEGEYHDADVSVEFFH